MDNFEPINATFYRNDPLETADALTVPEAQRNHNVNPWQPRELAVPAGVNKIVVHWDGVSPLFLWTRTGGSSSSVRRIEIEPGKPTVYTFSTTMPNSRIWFSVKSPSMEPVNEAVCGVTIIPGPLNSKSVGA